MRPALRLIPLIVIGALAAFLLVGPLASLYKTRVAASRPQTSATPSASVGASASSCPASLPAPQTAPTPLSDPQPALPFALWVNDPLGVNLRSSASTSGTLIRTLSQGTLANADGQATDASGAHWYHVSIGSQSGYLRADFVVSHSIHVLSGPGWSLMLPDKYTGPASSDTTTEVAAQGEALPFLRVQASTSGPPAALPLPAMINRHISSVPDHSKVVQVWSYTVLEQVLRIPIDTCNLPTAGARQDGGWPYMTTVSVKSSVRSYQFTFFTQEPDSTVVKQVLDSVAVS